MPSELSLNALPEYLFSSFRHFQKHEKFVTRYCADDVLILMIGGVLRFHEDGIPIELHPGQYYIQRRGLFQQGVEESNEPEYYYVHFHGDFSPSEKSLSLHGSADIASMIPMFRELDHLINTNAAKIACAAAFFQILVRLADAQSAYPKSIVQSVLDYTFRNNHSDVSLDEIAGAVGYCKTHIINTFRRETGKTPHAYITEQRLHSAKHLLLHSDLTLEQISARCGFGSYINFYKNFTKQERVSPTIWRQQHRPEAGRP